VKPGKDGPPGNLDAIGERLDPGAAERMWKLRNDLLTSQACDPGAVKAAEPDLRQAAVQAARERGPRPRPEPRRWRNPSSGIPVTGRSRAMRSRAGMPGTGTQDGNSRP